MAAPTKKTEPTLSGAAAGAAHHSMMELFQDRNALKRKLEEADAERAVLRADVEDMRKRHEEVQRQLASLEKMLTDPEKAQNAILYYRLRAVWDTCRNMIRGMAEELSARQDEAERKRYTEAYEQQRASQLNDLQRLVEILDRDRQGVAAGITEMEVQVEKLKWFWQKKRRERLMQDIEEAIAKLNGVDKRRAELAAKTEQVRKAPIPTYLGIGIPARRAINTALLALTQYLYLHFMEHDIAQMARGAGTKPVSDAYFGLANECLNIGMKMWDVVVKLKDDKLRSERLKQRTEYLRQKLSYASDADSVPEESSISFVLPTSQNSAEINAEYHAIPVNVLALNYWDIQALLLKPPEKAEQAPAVKGIGTGD